MSICVVFVDEEATDDKLSSKSYAIWKGLVALSSSFHHHHLPCKLYSFCTLQKVHDSVMLWMNPAVLRSLPERIPNTRKSIREKRKKKEVAAYPSSYPSNSENARLSFPANATSRFFLSFQNHRSISFRLDLNLHASRARHRLSVLDLDVLTLLLHKLVQLLVGLVPILINLLPLFWLAASLWRDHDNTGRTLGATSCAKLGTRCQEDVGDVVVLAQNGDVADDVHGGDVCGEDDDSRGKSRSRSGRVTCGRLADGLDDFFDAALKALLLGGCCAWDCQCCCTYACMCGFLRTAMAG